MKNYNSRYDTTKVLALAVAIMCIGAVVPADIELDFLNEIGMSVPPTYIETDDAFDKGEPDNATVTVTTPETVPVEEIVPMTPVENLPVEETTPADEVTERVEEKTPSTEVIEEETPSDVEEVEPNESPTKSDEHLGGTEDTVVVEEEKGSEPKFDPAEYGDGVYYVHDGVLILEYHPEYKEVIHPDGYPIVYYLKGQRIFYV